MMSFCEKRVVSARSKKGLVYNTKIVPADTEKSTFKRNV